MRRKMGELFFRIVDYSQRHEKASRPVLLALFLLSLWAVGYFTVRIIHNLRHDAPAGCSSCGRPVEFPALPGFPE